MIRQTKKLLASNWQTYFSGRNGLAILLLALIFNSGCQKDQLLNSPGNIAPTNPAMSIGNVSYNATYDVLVFNDFQQVRDLSDELDQLNAAYPYDQGNQSIIESTMLSIQTNGFYQGSGGSQNQVNLNDFEQLLLASYPLSNDVLLGLMQLNDNLNGALPGQFLTNVMNANVPFTYDVEQAVQNGSMPMSVKQGILNVNDNTLLVPDHAFQDFLSQYPAFNSLYEALENQMETKLLAGVDPASQQFDDHFVRDDFTRLIMNDGQEVYIAGHLYKLFTDCSLAVFLGSLQEAYAELNMLSPTGFTPTPATLPETNAGIPIATMNANFPMDFTMVNPGTYDPITNSAENHQQDFSPNCPEANFTVNGDDTNWLLFHFNRFDPAGYPGTDYYQYWTFGDGTGSFADDPDHLYAAAGDYTVKLTIFKEDCGCWDTYTTRVTAGSGQDRGDCEATFAWEHSTPLNKIDFEIDSYEDELGTPITNVAWDFGDGVTSPTNAGTTTNHTYGADGVYTVTMTVTFASTCVAEYTNLVGITNFTQCCDLFDGLALPAYDPFGLDDHRLLIEDFARGHAWLLGAKLKGKQTFYRRKTLNPSKWKQAKANHLIELSGSVQELDGEKICSGISVPIPPGIEATEDNKKSCKLSIPAAVIGGINGFGMQENSILFEHAVEYGALIMLGKMIPLGDC